MGNHLRGMSLLSNGHFPYHVQLGRHGVIDAKLDVDLGPCSMVWSVSYTVEGSTCAMQLSHLKFYNLLGMNIMSFEIRDDICSGGGIRMWVKKVDNNDLLEADHFECFGRFADMVSVKVNENRNHLGEVTKTNVSFYGKGSKGGLVVREQKIKKGDKKPYKVTVAHYYAASSGNVYGQNTMDIGLSMVVHVQASNNELDFTVEGPIQHPASALFYMFEQVLKSGIWKPMACPHCATIQSQSSIFRKAESEDSDSIPPARLRGPKQDSGSSSNSVIANGGVITGNNNGNLIFNIVKKKLRDFVSS